MELNLAILLIEDDSSLSADLTDLVSNLGVGRLTTATSNIPIEQLAALNSDLAILGPSLNSDVCMQCMHKLKIIDLSIPVLTSCIDGCLAVKYAPYLFKGIYHINPEISAKDLIHTIGKAVKDKSAYKIKHDFPVLIGQSQAVFNFKQKIQKVAGKDITVLITGETGTGKELIARSLHYYSQRSSGPLVKVNCGSLPDELLESEVFGFQKGAFTDAHRDKPGRLELADGGTLFIDEIGDLSLNLQVKFLQVLEEKEFSRLGSTYDKVIDTRVVAATNVDLQEKVRDGSFRKDLFYRLNVVHIEAPPLRKRKDDISLLIHYFMNKYCYEFKKETLAIPDNIANLLNTYHWPGNIRELENVIRRAIALRDWAFIFKELQFNETERDANRMSVSTHDEFLFDWDESQLLQFFEKDGFSLRKVCKEYVSEAERQLIIKTLQETQWNRTKAARQLQVSYKTLLNRIDEFELKPK